MGQAPDPVRIERQLRDKTGALFGVAAELGGWGQPEVVRAELRRFGEHLGFAFQLVDDLLDATGDSECMGKATGTDARAGRTTLVELHGAEKVRVRAQQELEHALLALERAVGAAPAVEALARAAVGRDR